MTRRKKVGHTNWLRCWGFSELFRGRDGELSSNRNRNDREVDLVPWVIASVILHLLIIFLYPERPASAISTPSPFRDGVMQVSIRTVNEQLNAPALRLSAGPQPTVRVETPVPQPLPQRVQPPTEQAPVIAPNVRPQTAPPPIERVEEIRPEVRVPERLDQPPIENNVPERVIMPLPERPEPVESPGSPVTVQAPPTPQQIDIQPLERRSLPLPLNEAPDRTEVPAQQQPIARPDPVAQPEVRSASVQQPIVERPSPQVVAPAPAPERTDVEVPPEPEPPSTQSAPSLGSNPQRPVPPPTYGSSLQFPKPGTIDPPKRMISLDVETVEVLITYDETGSIIDAVLIPETASADEAVNAEAPLYVRYNVSVTQPAPAGQVCQARVLVSFSMIGGTSFSFANANERVVCFVP